VAAWTLLNPTFIKATATTQPVARVREAAQPLWRERPRGEPALGDFRPPSSLAPLIRQVSPSVVNVSTFGREGAGSASGEAEYSVGSGFVILPAGYVVTNDHVVDKAQRIEVKLSDGRQFAAEVVGRDPSTDVALLHLLGQGVKDLPSTFLGDSDKLQVGDWVVAIGNPFGLDHSVSLGIISAKERVIGMGPFDDFIQTDALINPGNSGGPLFNMRGEVVGVNTAIINRGQGIGFAVPINMVKDLLPNLLVNGHLERGWLGVNVIEERSAQGPAQGAVVKQVFRDSPAATAGIRPGDRVLAVNGRPVESYLQLLRRIAFLAPGSEAILSVLRDGATRDFRLKLSRRPAADSEPAPSGPAHSDSLGMVLKEVTSAVGAALHLAPNSGVLVSMVLPGGPADHAGLKSGDLLTEVNRHKVNDLRSFEAAMERTGSDRKVLVRFQRGELVKYAAVRLN
jgi:serine protease Do